MLPDKLLTAPELAERLSVSLATIRDWTCQGILPVYRLGRAVRYSVEEIEAWLEQRHEVPAGSVQ